MRVPALALFKMWSVSLFIEFRFDEKGHSSKLEMRVFSRFITKWRGKDQIIATGEGDFSTMQSKKSHIHGSILRTASVWGRKCKVRKKKKIRNWLD